MSSGIRRNLSLSKAEKAHRPAAGGDAARTPPGAIRAAYRRNPRGTAVSGGYLDSPKGWESSIIEKMKKSSVLANRLRRLGEHRVYYSRKIGSFTQVLDFKPAVYDRRHILRDPSEFKELRFDSIDEATLVLLDLNSSLFVWFCTVYSDCRHVNKREVEAFPLPYDDLENESKAARSLATKLMKSLKDTSEMRRMGALDIQCIIPKLSKPIIDEIDALLAKHYGFTEEELDFIVNYDIKYRMGDELAAGGE